MTRRQALYSAAGAAVWAGAMRGETRRSTMGIASTSYMGVRRFRDSQEFLEHCSQLGAGGIQAQINGDPAKLRSRAEQLGMFVEAIVGMPKSSADLAGFEQAARTAKEAGASCVRVNAGGRRYEDFSTREAYQAFADRSLTLLKAIVPICEKHKIAFALENHKDWTLDQMVSILQTYSSEYFGACLDFGNNISLLDDPMETAERLAPYAITTHVKDMGVEPYPDGFLLSEMPLGAGFLNLPGMFEMVRKARPGTKFNLEMITRDPLKVPCLTDRYWATFPERGGVFLARTIRLVKKEAKATPLPRVTQLPRAQQLQTEEENVQACMAYAREKLGC